MALTQASPPKFIENRRAIEAQRRWDAAIVAVDDLLAAARTTQDAGLASRIVDAVHDCVTSGPTQTSTHGNTLDA